MSQNRTAESEQAFAEAYRLAKDEIPTHKRQYRPKPGWWGRRKLKRASLLLERVLILEPRHWGAMWLLGMVHKRFGDYATALSWFERAYPINPSYANIAREACSSALELGRHAEAIEFARRAVQAEPADHGLQANLALAFLIAGRLAEARAAIDRAIAGNPSDKISLALRGMIEHFTTNRARPPATLRALHDYRNAHRLP